MALLHLLLLSQALFLAVIVLKLLYRFTLHPLSRIPGPRLAAATNLYAVYHDLFSNESLVKRLGALHDKYGPLVRISVFKVGSDFNRAPEFYNAPQVEGCFLNVSDGRVAKPHRDLFVQAFSKAQINGLEPLIHEKVSIFLARLKEAAVQNKAVDLDLALNCLTGDVTMYYCHQMNLGLLDAPEFRHHLIVELHEFAPIVPFFWYFPNFANVMNKVIFSMLPEPAVQTLFPAAGSMLQMRKECGELIHSLARSPPDSKEVTSSIFRAALNPNREKGQYVASSKELTADAVLMFLAGTDTTAHALTFGIWEMVKNQKLWIRLQEELASVLPDAESLAPLRELESLPFLRSVVKESLRFSMGTSARLPRIVPRQGAVLCGHKIAPGTRVSFSHYVYNNDPTIFSEPHTFNPERWLGANVDELEKHMVSFSRGSRSCIGINLAHAELFTTFAHLARRFDIINDGTTDEAMSWKDAYTPLFKGSLRVKLKPR